MPLGFFLALAGLVVPDFGRRHVQRRDGSAARCIAQFSIASEIADENDFVHAAHSWEAFYIVFRPQTAGVRRFGSYLAPSACLARLAAGLSG